MVVDWCITNGNDLAVFNGLNYCKVYPGFTIHSEKPLKEFQINNIELLVHINGYILPINEESFIDLSNQRETIRKLFLEHGENFINKIKGIFTIIIVWKNQCLIFTDKIGLSKVYYSQINEKWIVTNRLEFALNKRQTKLNRKSIIIYSLFNHFIEGYTPFENIFFSLPASRFLIKNKLNASTYWSPNSLFNLPKALISVREFGERFRSIIRQYIDSIGNGKISLTLTGGLDSRLILSAMVSLGIKPDVLVYGQVGSPDVRICKTIADRLGLRYFHSKTIPTPEWFSGIASHIINEINPLISIHRAHRFDAFRHAKEMGCYNELLLSGYLGGELIRNYYYDGLTTSDFAWENINKVDGKLINIHAHLKKRFIKSSLLEIEEIRSELASFSFFNQDIAMNKALYTILVLASIHHWQDIELAQKYFSNAVPIYLDENLLTLIFTSQYNFLQHKNSINKLSTSHELYCKVIDYLAPELSLIPINKRGAYTPWELVHNYSLIFYSKRFFRYLSENSPIQNFPLDRWLYDYVKGVYKTDTCFSPEINEIFDIKSLRSSLEKDKNQKTEKYWRVFTDPIYLDIILTSYQKRHSW